MGNTMNDKNVFTGSLMKEGIILWAVCLLYTSDAADE